MNFIKRKEKQCNNNNKNQKNKAKANNFELNQINLLTISKRIIYI